MMDGIKQPTNEEMIAAIEDCKDVENGPLNDEAKRVCRNTRIMMEKELGRPRKNPVTIDDQGHETVEVMARQQGNTGAALIPKTWIGHRVRVTLLD